MQQKIETLWKTFEATNEWIKFSDAKAGFVLAANGIFVTIIVSYLVEHKAFVSDNWLLVILFVIWLILAVLSTVYSILCLNPTLVTKQKDSLIFFMHIAKNFDSPDDYNNAVSEKYSDDNEIFNQLTNQVWAVSKVAEYKCKMIVLSIKFFLMTVLFGILALGFVIFVVITS
ncbi:MAG: Pycsar system effector family protein [Cyanobacteriota bacterium]